MHAALVRGGERAGEELVRQLMRELGLVACQPAPWRPQTTQQGAAGPIPDLEAYSKFSLKKYSPTAAR